MSYICSRYYRAPELIFGATDYTCQIGTRDAAASLATRRTSSRRASCAACRLPSLPPPPPRRRVPTPFATRHSGGCSAPRVAPNARPRARTRPHADNARVALIHCSSRLCQCQCQPNEMSLSATASRDLTSAFVARAVSVSECARMRRPSRAAPRRAAPPGPHTRRASNNATSTYKVYGTWTVDAAPAICTC